MQSLRLLALVLPICASLLAAALPAECEADGTCDDAEVSLLSLRAAKSGSRVHAAADDQPDPDWSTHYPPRRPVAISGSCYMNNSTSAHGPCALKDMTAPTLVYPGGDNTKCMLGDDYAFLVTPGAQDKLVIYYQGGGACWEANGAYGKIVVEQCINNLQWAIAASGAGVGIQDFTNPANPFIGYTFVEILYCSGDAFMGATTMVSQSNGATLYQNGYAQAAAALAWTKANMNSNLDLVVTGFSAGAVGLMGWANTVLSSLKFKSATVLADSYVSLFPADTQEQILIRWGGCGTPLVTDPAACAQRKVNIHGLFQATMTAYPQVAFASIESKTDGTQIWFYQGVAQSFGLLNEMGITPEQFYAGANAIMGQWSQSSPNYVAYIIDGAQHCFIVRPNYFSSSILGPGTSSSPILSDWVSDVVGPLHSAMTQCNGPVTPDDSTSSAYCSQGLLPKSLAVTGPGQGSGNGNGNGNGGR